ncbi:MAG: SulP family inorganic anion transporter [Planctomycetota bacterium]|jgi:MFS superfamily sulfate permease-like transporter
MCDLRSGTMVAMVSLPFSMGIAITSGAPPVCGVISAVIAGFLLPFLGGSYVTISGPAAGLAPALFAGMISLATAEIGKEAAAAKTTQELLAIGYPLVLVAIAIAGVLQVILARFKVARLSAIFPAAAIEGMLAAIGMIIMVKQLPLILGVDFVAHDFWGMIREIPSHVGQIYTPALITGVGCTIALFVLNSLPFKLLKVMPPPVWVFIFGSVIFQAFFHIPSAQFTQEQRDANELLKRQLTSEHRAALVRLDDELKSDLERTDLTTDEREGISDLHEQIARDLRNAEFTPEQTASIEKLRRELTPEQIKAYEELPHVGYCISIPDDPMGGIQLPNFDRIVNYPHTWGVLAYVVFVLLLIDATESLATIVAVDKLDPFKRRSDPDTTLQAMGGCNLASSIVGGLTIIPGIVKSTANIIGGGRTLWANFFNAVMLLVFMFLARPLINQVPLAVLASILIFVGWKLCGPKVWKHTASIGVEQFGVFLITLLVTVSTDLLIGIGVGILVKLLMGLSLIGLANRINGKPANGSFVRRFRDLFRNPVGRRETDDGVYNVYLERPLHCFNLVHVIRELEHVPDQTSTLRLHFTTLSNVIDHTSVETVFHYLEDYKLKGVNVEMVGWERFIPLSEHDSAVRFSLASRPQETMGAL